MSRTGIECHCKRGGKLTVGWMERIGVFRTEPGKQPSEHDLGGDW